MKDVNINSTSIKHWAIDDRPREKMLQNGAAILSNAELLAILINNGSKDKSALDLAKEIMNYAHNKLSELHLLELNDFKKIKGIGPAKAITIMAALELGKRRHAENSMEKIKAGNKNAIIAYLKTQLQNHTTECFGIIYCKSNLDIIGFEIVSEGGLSHTVMDVRIIFKKAFEKNATQIILCHNHPGGNLKPSKADIDITKQLIAAGVLLKITVMDHIIVSQTGSFSFADNSIVFVTAE